MAERKAKPKGKSPNGAAKAAEQVVDPQVTIPDWGFLKLVFSDYRYAYRYRQETVGRSLLLMLPRYLLTPHLQFALTVRAAQCGPGWVARIMGYIQIVVFSSEMFTFHHPPGIKLGAAIEFPHPYGVMMGPGTVIGSRVSIYHHTMIGTNRRWYPGDEVYAPTIGDDCVIGGCSRVLGPYKLGQGVVTGLNVFVKGDLPAWSTQLLSGVREQGEWTDERWSGREPVPPPELLELATYPPAEQSAGDGGSEGLHRAF